MRVRVRACVRACARVCEMIDKLCKFYFSCSSRNNWSSCVHVDLTVRARVRSFYGPWKSLVPRQNVFVKFIIAD